MEKKDIYGGLGCRLSDMFKTLCYYVASLGPLLILIAMNKMPT